MWGGKGRQEAACSERQGAAMGGSMSRHGAAGDGAGRHGPEFSSIGLQEAAGGGRERRRQVGDGVSTWVPTHHRGQEMRARSRSPGPHNRRYLLGFLSG